jgi:hypothetical protein
MWAKCKRRYFWSNIFGGTGLIQLVNGVHVEPEYLTFGKAVHHALSLYYDLSTPRDVEPFQYEEVAKDSYFDELGLHGEWEATEEEIERAEFAGKIVKAYVEEHMGIEDYNVVKVEDEFRAVLGECCWKCGKPYDDGHNIMKSDRCYDCGAPVYILVGRIDLLISEDTMSRRLIQVDHKTTQSYSEDYMNAFGHSFQQIGYCYGYGKAHGIDMNRFGINFLQKAKTIDDPERDLKRCPDCKAGKKKILTCETCSQTGKVEREAHLKLQPFRRQWYDIPDKYFDLYLLATISKIREIEHEREIFAAEPDAAYPMEESSCKGCKFTSLCWDGPVQEWYKPTNSALEGFHQRPADYVDLMTEEKV